MRTCQFVNGTSKVWYWSSSIYGSRKIGDLISWWIDTGSNVDSEKGLKWDTDTGVNIESRSGIKLSSWGSWSHSFSSSISGKR